MPNPTPANDNNQRPAEFDAAVMSYLPAFRNLARKYAHKYRYRYGAEELLQNTIATILASWHTFHGTSFEHGGGFYKWVSWRMKGVCANEYRIPAFFVEAPRADVPVQPSQEHAVDLALTLDKLAAMSDEMSSAVMQTAMGVGCSEQAAVAGISPAGIVERTRRARAELRGEHKRKNVFTRRHKRVAA